MLTQHPQRKFNRLSGYDYTHDGVYYVTVCTHERVCWFGEVVAGQVMLSPLGNLVYQEWEATENLRDNVLLDVFIVMPNHLHALFSLQNHSDKQRATHRVAPTGARLIAKSVGAIIGQFKSTVTRRARERRVLPDTTLWQRGYYDHIVRKEEDLHRIRAYILNNPERWQQR